MRSTPSASKFFAGGGREAKKSAADGPGGGVRRGRGAAAGFLAEPALQRAAGFLAAVGMSPTVKNGDRLTSSGAAGGMKKPRPCKPKFGSWNHG